jgi:hypothetical protein
MFPIIPLPVFSFTFLVPCKAILTILFSLIRSGFDPVVANIFAAFSFSLLTEVRIRIRFRKIAACSVSLSEFTFAGKFFPVFFPGRNPATFAFPDQIPF